VLDPADPWFATVPAVLLAAGVDVPTNRTYIRISSPNRDAERLIAEHFGWQGKVMVESDGTGAALLPRGSLVVVARGPSGAPVGGLRCIALPDMAGAYEAPTDVPVTDDGGRCRLELPATGYWIRLDSADEAGSTVGTGRAVVPAHGRAEVVIDTQSGT